jgi:pyruvate dehydrogenase E1 component alpha subunit
MADFGLGILGANGIVGGGIPIAVGAALGFAMQAERLQAEPRLALAFFGDGATNEGAFHEAANQAGTWKLPVIFFCENNLYGEGTAIARSTPVSDLAVRAAAYAIPAMIVDGNDVLAVYAAVRAAAEQARRGGGPTFIEAKTYRLRGHYEGDPQVYRSAAEIEAWKERDPIPALRLRLLRSGRFDDGALEELQGQVFAQLDEAVAYAAAAPRPAPADALAGVYADTHGGLVF